MSYEFIFGLYLECRCTQMQLSVTLRTVRLKAVICASPTSCLILPHPILFHSVAAVDLDIYESLLYKPWPSVRLLQIIPGISPLITNRFSRS